MLALILFSIVCCCFVSSENFISLPMERILLPKRTIGFRDGSQINLKNVENVAYSTIIYVGKDLQPFSVQVDTGSAELFIPSTYCRNCGIHQRHTCMKQITDSFDLNYGLGSASGPLCEEQITIGGLTVRNQHFVVAEEIDNHLRSYPFDGIMGMALKEASLSNSVPIIHNLLKQHNMTKKVFSFYLTKEEKGKSELTIGGSNPKYYYGDFSYVPVKGYEGQWEIFMDSFGIGGEILRNWILPSRAILDTGNTDISIPNRFFDQVHKVIKKAIPEVKVETRLFFGFLSGYVFHVPSEDVSKLPVIELIIAEKKFTLEPNDYKGYFSELYPQHHEILLTTIPGHKWLLGDIFFRKVYTQFDISEMRVGFADII